MQLLTHVLTILATNSWETFEDSSFGHDAFVPQNFMSLSKMLLLTVVLLWKSGMQRSTMLSVT